jgi:SP family general alpha glucoside:H+ symporter-like MFS transporter
VWGWFKVPETMGRSFEDLDVMFARGVKTREFKEYRI